MYQIQISFWTLVTKSIGHHILVIVLICQLVIGINNNNSSIRRHNNEEIGSGLGQSIKLGSVLHLFPRYGYLSLSMRVVPRNDSIGWIFLEPTRDVFQPSTIKIQQESFGGINNNNDGETPLDNEFHIDLCEDIPQLVQAYFRRFVVEGLEKPWLAFGGGWRTPSIAKYFGLDPAYVKGDYKYMLVRVLLVKSTGKFQTFGNVSLLPGIQDKIQDLRIKDIRGIYRFFNDVGTHYIHSFLTGNSIYQVFVYEEGGYEAVKRRLTEKNSRSSYMSQLPYLLPLWVKHIGKVMILNSNTDATNGIRDALSVRFLFTSYPNIFKLHDNPPLVRRIQKYLKSEPDGLLGLDLRNLGLIFNSSIQRNWFIEALTQTMNLWEINL